MVTVAGGSSCGGLLGVAARTLCEVPIGDSPYLYAVEVVYSRRGQQRQAIWCFNRYTGTYPYIDVDDGKEVDFDSRVCVSRIILRASSPLPSSPYLAPRVFIHTKYAYLRMTPGRQLKEAPKSALEDPSLVAFLRGVRSGIELFWELRGGWNFVNAETGQEFHFKEIPGGPKQHVLVLIGNEDPVPFVAVPQFRTLFVMRRSGLELRVVNGCLSTEEPMEPSDIERWDIPRDIDAFDVDFTHAARRK